MWMWIFIGGAIVLGSVLVVLLTGRTTRQRMDDHHGSGRGNHANLATEMHRRNGGDSFGGTGPF